MIVLALETSQHQGGVALRRADGTVDVEAMASGRHNDDLMPAIDRVVRRAGLTPADLDAIALSVGPGGFTGLRIAVSTAKMLAYATGASIVAVPTAEVVVEGSAVDGAGHGTLMVVLPTKRQSLWSAPFERSGGKWAPAEAGLAQGAAVCLDGISAVVADEHQSPELLSRAPRVIPAVYCPAACLRVGERYLAESRMTAAADLAPLYPRAPEAVSLWAKRQSRA